MAILTNLLARTPFVHASESYFGHVPFAKMISVDKDFDVLVRNSPLSQRVVLHFPDYLSFLRREERDQWIMISI